MKVVPSVRPRQRKKLAVMIGSVQLENPTILASGVLGVAAGGLVRAWKGGAGAVVTKTVGLEPREGYPGPRIVGVSGGGLINAMGLPNPGIHEYLTEIKEAQKAGVLIIGSVLGDSAAEYAAVARQLANTNVVAIELNVSCPHVGSLYVLGLHPDHVALIVKTVIQKTENQVPIWIKLPGTTDYPRLVAVAKAAEAAGASAVVAINTLPALAINVESQQPYLGGGVGGLSGPAIKPIAIRAIWELYQAGLSIPIVGAGGIVTGKDVVEFMLAGASAVEIGTGILLRESTIFRDVCEELDNYLKRLRIANLSDLIGNVQIMKESGK